MKEEEQSFTHSDTISYLLQRRLSFILRYGMSFLFVIAALVLVSLYFVKVPDTLEGKFTLSSSNPPKSLVAKVSARVTQKLVEDKQQVKAGQLVARLESAANPDEVNLLEHELRAIEHFLDSNKLDSIKLIELDTKQQLGELQQAYEQFKKSNNELYMALANGQYLQEKYIIDERLNNLQQTREQLLKQKKIYKREFDLANEDYQIDSFLRKQGSITQTELRAAESARLQKRLSMNSLEQSLIANETSINDIGQQKINLDKTIAVQKSAFFQSYSLLKVALLDWKLKYMLIAPVDGVVSYSRSIYPGIQVQAGEPLLFVVPEVKEWIAELLIPQQNFGKLKLGQRAILKLESYNYEEFGVVEGEVSNVAQIPQEIKSSEGMMNLYMVQLKLDSSFTTNYKKRITPIHGLTGVAAIVLDDKSLLEKLFLDKFKSLFVYQ